MIVQFAIGLLSAGCAIVDIPDTDKFAPTVKDVLTPTVWQSKFSVVGAEIVGVPVPNTFNSSTPKLFSAIILFSYL